MTLEGEPSHIPGPELRELLEDEPHHINMLGRLANESGLIDLFQKMRDEDQSVEAIRQALIDELHSQGVVGAEEIVDVLFDTPPPPAPDEELESPRPLW